MSQLAKLLRGVADGAEKTPNDVQAHIDALERVLATIKGTQPTNRSIEVENFTDIAANLPELAPELIQGVLRQGHKMLVQARSKAGKSFSLIELSIAISEGRQWLNLQCKQGQVLYINLEIDRPSFLHRIDRVRKALGIEKLTQGNLQILNLRGKSITLEQLVDMLEDYTKGQNIRAVIVDPIYKLIEGDENSAEAIRAFARHLDRIADTTGASIIYVHHHSKGAQGQKSSIDRSSGSGVFARDADAIIDMIEIDPTDAGVTLPEGQTAWRVEGTLREFAPFKPFDIVFTYPIHVVRDDLSGADYKEGASITTKRKRGTEATRTKAIQERERCITQLIEFANWELYPKGMNMRQAWLEIREDNGEGSFYPAEKTFRRWLDYERNDARENRLRFEKENGAVLITRAESPK